MPWDDGGYRAPGWALGRHVQTCVPAKLSPKPRVRYTRETWDTPDGDFNDIDWVGLQSPAQSPLVVLLHGLEGSSKSHYALAMMHAVEQRGWKGCVANFRGCSGRPNRRMRAYNAGDDEFLEWFLRGVRDRFPQAPLFAAGVSLGGNLVSVFCGRRPGAARELLCAAASLGGAIDLAASSIAIGKGINRLYNRMFLRTLVAKTLQKFKDFQEMHALVDEKAIRGARDFYDFDSAYTARMHGFADAMDYWTKSSAKPHLQNVRVPLLLLNALNDPFIPAWCLPGPEDVSASVYLDYPKQGGHIGFPTGPFPGSLGYLPARTLGFFERFLPGGRP